MDRTFRAPGRVNLIGEHTDYTGGLVLPAALDRAVTLTGRAVDGRIALRSEQFDTPVTVAADGTADGTASGWGRYVAAVAAELDVLGRPPVGFEGTISSDLPTGAGVSSSAALEMAVAVALCAVADFSLQPLELAAVGQRAEQAVGIPCGIMDQAASVLGRAGHAVLLDCGLLEHELVPLPEDLALVVIDSGVSRQLEDSGYARRREELEAGLVAAGQPRPTDVDPEEVDAVTAGLDPVRARRVRHVVTENARVRAAQQALTAPGGTDRAALGRLFAQSHASLRDDFEVSTPELDLLVALSLEAGAVAARMTGGGFGGSIIALVELSDAAALGDQVAERYAEQTGGTAHAHLCRAGDGAGEVTR